MAANKKLKKKIIVEEPVTAEEKILGKQGLMRTKLVKAYEDRAIKYRVTNLQVKNNPVIVNGTVIESFIGSKNLEARNALKEGAEKVITKDLHGNDMFQIEVLD